MVETDGVMANDLRRPLRSMRQMRLSVGIGVSGKKDKVSGSSESVWPGKDMVCKRSAAARSHLDAGAMMALRSGM